MKETTSNLRKGGVFTAFMISINLNALMILMGTVGNAVKPLAILGKISNAIAAPTGFLVGWLIHPRVNSVLAVVVASLEGLIASIAFYTLVAWIVLRFVVSRKSSKNSVSNT